MHARGAWPLFIAMAVVASGCAAPAAVQPTGAGEETHGAPRVVLALVDTGINPWHAAFALPEDWEAQLPATAVTVPGSFREEARAEGPEAWNRLERDTLYWFEGTRVLAISKAVALSEEFGVFNEVFGYDRYPIHDELGHGTATASVAAAYSPHAWIVMVETYALSLDGYRWAAEQPWIDVVSTSQGNLGHLPNNETSGRDAYADATLLAVQSGKLVVGAGGNDPSPRTFDDASPPWVIGVGGAEADRKGASPLTSQPVDVVANLTWSGLADRQDNDATFTSKGTSFGAPAIAGVLAEAVFQQRSALGHAGGIRDGVLVEADGAALTNRDFRRALNWSASYWNTTDYKPSVNTSLHPLFWAYEVTNPAVPRVDGTPLGPWLQMGWGFVDASTTDAIVALLEGRAQAPDKLEATAYMERLHEVRSALWEARQG